MGDTKERPIPFSDLMVQAILEGRKTQTRRIIDTQPPRTLLNPTLLSRDPAAPSGYSFISDEYGEIPLKCRYGKPGDHLYVRERYFQYGHWEPVPGVRTKTGRMKWRFVPDSETIHFPDTMPFRQLDHKIRGGRHHKDPATPAWHQRLARFMPRTYARILLEVVSVRVERLQDISEADAEAEGACNSLHLEGGRFANENFAHLWWTINGDGSWEANPWVWVVEFRRIEP